MSSEIDPRELTKLLKKHAKATEKAGSTNPEFDQYAILGLHADLRVFIENWDAYDDRQQQQIAAVTNNVTSIRDEHSDYSGTYSVEDYRIQVEELKDALDAKSSVGESVMMTVEGDEPPAIAEFNEL